jgi:3-methylcrotonyl-CoA carboxylase beta subunit
MADKSIEYLRNEDNMKVLLGELRKVSDKIKLGGGQKSIDKHKAKGKLTARERIALLLDPHTKQMEIGLYAAHDMYAEQGGCVSAGVVSVIGYIHGRLCMILANDATVKAGAWFPMTGKKNLRAQEIAMENRIPIIYLVDSAGAFLPMQDEIFPDKENFGRIFRNNAVMSASGVPQIAAIMGSCVAGGAYLPIMSDEALIVEGTGSVFLAGSYLVKSAIGEDIDNETLGGAHTHCEISGVTDYKMKNDEECLAKIRSLVSKMGHNDRAGYDRIAAVAPAAEPKEMYGVMPADSGKQYDMMDLLKHIIDGGEIDLYKDGYGQSIVCGYARVEGWAVGIVANQRKVVKSKKGEMQFGGVIYSDSADKAARFIMNCNQKKIPLVFIQDVTGFMVGSRSEQGGIIKDGAKLVAAVANSVVPKFTIIAGNSYGAGNYAMCGKAYDPRLIFSWPGSKIAVMGGEQAAKTMVQIQVQQLKAKGEEINPDVEKALFDDVKAKYDRTLDPKYAAARLWTDGIIDPVDTRSYIAMGIEMANHAPITRPFNVGIIQT